MSVANFVAERIPTLLSLQPKADPSDRLVCCDRAQLQTLQSATTTVSSLAEWLTLLPSLRGQSSVWMLD
jgi:hypothetical protein